MASVPPFNMKLRGRQTIKAPTRYEEPGPHDDSEQEVCQARVVVLPPPAVHGRGIPYNPDLPQAAFPSRFFVETEPIPTANPTDTLLDPDHPTNRNTWSPESELELISIPAHLMERSTFDGPMISGMDEDYDMSNGPQNPVWAENMKLMDRLSARTDEDWNMAEMETSDEEEPSARPLEYKAGPFHARTSKHPVWEELSVAHRIDLVDRMMTLFPTMTEAMQRLHLKGPQRQAMADLIDKRNQHIAAEDANVMAFQTRAHEIFMSGKIEDRKHMTQAGYRRLVEEHLYKTIGDDDYSISTDSELAKAKEYLVHCGQKVELLNHWSNASASLVSRTSPEKTVPLQSPPRSQPNNKLIASNVPSITLPIEPPRLTVQRSPDPIVQPKFTPRAMPRNPRVAKHAPATPSLLSTATPMVNNSIVVQTPGRASTDRIGGMQIQTPGLEKDSRSLGAESMGEEKSDIDGQPLAKKVRVHRAISTKRKFTMSIQNATSSVGPCAGSGTSPVHNASTASVVSPTASVPPATAQYGMLIPPAFSFPTRTTPRTSCTAKKDTTTTRKKTIPAPTLTSSDSTTGSTRRKSKALTTTTKGVTNSATNVVGNKNGGTKGV